MNNFFTNTLKSNTMYKVVYMLFAVFLLDPVSFGQSWQSSILNYNTTGKLNYVSDAAKNRIPNFSFAGYKRGESPIPTVPVKKTISAIAGDNTASIQAAIDYVGGLTADVNGIRGAVLLNAGYYRVYGTLYIKYDGVVLRGVGNGSDSLTNTILYGVGDGGVVINGDTISTQRSLVVAGGGTTNRWSSGSSTKTYLTNDTLLVGDTVISMASTSSFAVGDNIIVYSPSTDAWLAAINYGGTHSTESGAEPGIDVPWTTSSELDIVFNRYVKAKTSTTITLDIPIYYRLVKSLSLPYIYKYTRSGLNKYIGVESLRIDNDYASSLDENHVWESLDMYQLEDSWVQNCTFVHFGQSGVRTATASRVTIQNCNAIDPISVITGERRYNFNFYQASQQILIQNCTATNGRHHYISNGTASTSGNVIYNCTSSGMYETTEGHRRWTQAILFDNLKELDGPRSDGNDILLGLYCRGYYGTSHGWAMVNGVAWNCDAAQGKIVIQQPPTGQNYAIGCKGSAVTGNTPIAPFSETQGYIEGTNVTGLVPQSLYKAQFQERMGSYTAPTTQASGLQFSSITPTSFIVRCTAGNGAQRIIVVRAGSSVTSAPANSTTYTGNSIFGSGSQVGTGDFVVYRGTGIVDTISGLSSGTIYYVNVYELNGSAGNEVYLTTTPATGSVTTSIVIVKPTIQCTNVQFSGLTSTSVTISCTKGNGTKRIILVRSGSAVTSNPVDNTTYTPNNVFGSGTSVGTGNYTVYKDTGSSVVVTGLTAATTYYFNSYELNGSSGSESYLTTNPASNSITTTATEPTVQATNVQLSGLTPSSVTISCTKGNGTKRIIIVRSGSAVNSNPVDNTTYTAGSIFGSGSQVGIGNYTVFNDVGNSLIVTGLSAETTYYFSVYEYNGSGGIENYLLTNPASGSVTTPDLEPTVQATNVQFSNISTTSFTVSCTKGNGAMRIIVVRSGSAVTANPVDNITYSASSVFGSGTSVGTGNFTVYNDVGSSVTITGLSSEVTCYVNVYEFNGSAGTENYLTTNPATGSVLTLAAAPTVQATNILFSAKSTNSVTVSCTSGNGARRIIIARSGSAVASDPAEHTSYTGSSVFGSGTEIGTGNFVVYSGTGASVTVTGLSPSSIYYFAIYEFNGSGGSEDYLLTSPATGFVTTTASEPTLQSTNVQFTNVTTNSFTVSCTKGNGEKRILVVRAGSASAVDPVDNTTYSANAVYGSGGLIGTGNYCVYNNIDSTITVTGLNSNTSYSVTVYELNGSSGSENYFTANPASGSTTTMIVGIYSTGTGGVWTTAATWVGGVVPGTSDNVVIASGTTVTLGSAVTVLSTTINSGGKLNLTASSTLNGDITCYGVFTGSASTLTTNGNITVSGVGSSFAFSSSTGKIIGTAAKTFTLSNGATFELSVTGASPLATVVSGTWTWIVTNTPNNTTISYKNTGTTTITALPNSQTYGNLIIKSGGSASNNWTNTLGASLSILGNLTIANYTQGSVTPGAKNQTFNLASYTISGNGTNSIISIIDTSSGGTIILTNSSGTITNLGTSFPGFPTCSIKNNASVVLAIPGGTYTNLSLNGTGTMTLNANTIVNGVMTIANTPGLFSLSTYTLSYGSSASILYNGTLAQTTGAELPASIGGLTINNTAGVTLANSLAVTGSVTLTSGLLKLGNNHILTAGDFLGGSVTGMIAADYTNCEVRRTLSANNINGFTIPLGKLSPLEYTPVTFGSFAASAYSGAYLKLTIANGKYSSNSSTTNYLTHSWNISASGITSPVYLAIFTYGTADVTGTEANLSGGIYTGSAWQYLGAVNSTAHTISGSNLTVFGTVTAGESSIFPKFNLTVTLATEGYYDPGTGSSAMKDTFTVYIANSTSPFSFIDTGIVVIDSVSMSGVVELGKTHTGTYYIVVRHQNTIETWSKAGGESFVDGTPLSYDFTTAVSQAYGNNIVLKGTKYCFYSGDIDQNGFIDNNDLLLIDNDAYNFSSGYLATDLDGNQFIDNNDLLICDNNAFNFTGTQNPTLAKRIAKKVAAPPGNNIK